MASGTRNLYITSGNTYVEQDPILENGTNLGIKFTKNSVDYVTICTGHPTFDYSNGICQTTYIRYIVSGDIMGNIGTITRTIDNYIFRNGDPYDPYFGSEIAFDDPKALSNNKFFFKYAILNPIIPIGEYIYREIENFEGLN